MISFFSKFSLCIFLDFIELYSPIAWSISLRTLNSFLQNVQTFICLFIVTSHLDITLLSFFLTFCFYGSWLSSAQLHYHCDLPHCNTWLQQLVSVVVVECCSWICSDPGSRNCCWFQGLCSCNGSQAENLFIILPSRCAVAIQISRKI